MKRNVALGLFGFVVACESSSSNQDPDAQEGADSATRDSGAIVEADYDLFSAASSSAPGTVSGTGIRAVRGEIVALAFPLRFRTAGTFDVKFEPIDGTIGYTTSVVDSDQMIITPSELTADGVVSRSIMVRVRPEPNAADGQLRLSVSPVGMLGRRTLTYDIHVE